MRTLATLHNNFRALCSMCKVQLTFSVPTRILLELWIGNRQFCFSALAEEPYEGLIFNSLTPFPRFVFAAACVISVHNLTNFHEVRGVLRNEIPSNLAHRCINIIVNHLQTIISTIVGVRGCGDPKWIP